MSSAAHKDSAAAAAPPVFDEQGSVFQQQTGDMQTALNKAAEALEPMVEPRKVVQPEQPKQSALATGTDLPKSQLMGSSRDDLGSFRHEPSSYAAVTKQAGGNVRVNSQSAISGSSAELKETDAPARMQEGCQQEGHLASHSMAEVPKAQAQAVQGQV